MIRFRWLLAVALPAVLVSGCGSGSGDLVRRAADDFTAAITAGDSERACGMLTERAREGVECSSLDLPGGSVEAVEVWGDAAQVRTSEDVLFLRELSSGWRVSGAGCEAQSDRPYTCEVGGP
ncbi:hypothetical protein ALI22I_45360 [Saccharothrix sp. ALI-22-I]|uniref:hypothetical protein n=1 Tax=Saccharothrix sp. ALI-22-I TaxID=1933778 RepID=UPI00097C239D|nr:hypothetical protein [Saccharothrix sp. ALI-22-I]ONI80524.1 hypothetical protein ALI22I_45360 [Saccharothrix sp. ALI-22-I]